MATPSPTPAAADRINGVPVSQCLDLVEAVRDHVVQLDEPEALGGTNTAPNMVEAVLAAYGSCLTVGYTLNAAVRGIEVRSLSVDVEGPIDLAGFFGLSSDVPAGFSSIKATVRLDAAATPEQLADLHRHVLATSPVGSILQRPLEVTTELVTPA
jgi:uncharacterized OsmC-like protein